MSNEGIAVSSQQSAAGADTRYSVLSTQYSHLRAIDVDVHPRITDWRQIAPYAPEGLRHRIGRASGPPMARHGFKVIGDPFGDVPRPADEKAHPAGDPAWVQAEYLDKRG